MISVGDTTSRLAYNLRKHASFPKPAADAAASTATPETVFCRAPVRLVVDQVEYVPSAALTADAANLATITIRRRNADGTGAVTLASRVTDVAGGSWTAWVAKPFALTANLDDLELQAGQILTLEISKGGTGVVVPSGVCNVGYTRY